MQQEDTSSQLKQSPLKVAIIGSGLVGALSALYFTNLGYEVHLFEKRSSLESNQSSKRSINLALSERGRKALRNLGLETEALKDGLPMYARKIHLQDGTLSEQPYGKVDQCIYSVDRSFLNQFLLSKLPTSVQVYYSETLVAIDFKSLTMSFKSGTTFQADLIVGADGAHSKVRNLMLPIQKMDYQQNYIPHKYLELSLPAGPNNTHIIDNNCLHIWPRQEHMLIALPNPDGTFTCTLFAPESYFSSITTPAQLLDRFSNEYPDFYKLTDPTTLTQQFFENPRGNLMTVKCSKYHLDHKVILIGDAAHCMVPFYGQGMNCGFEDVTKLFELLPTSTNHPPAHQLQQVFETYTKARHPDVTAMCDLALYNYIEMRSHVASWRYLAKKHIVSKLGDLFPNQVIPLYTMVSFSTRRYSQVVKQWKQQDLWIDFALKLASLVTLGSVGLLSLRYFYRRGSTPLPVNSSAVGNGILPWAANLIGAWIYSGVNYSTKVITDLTTQINRLA